MNKYVKDYRSRVIAISKEKGQVSKARMEAGGPKQKTPPWDR